MSHPPGSRSEASAVSRRLLFLAVCGLGVSAFMTQLTLMRELMCVFSGNELVLGIVLGSWLLLTGLGSAVGRSAARLRRPLEVLLLAQIVVALMPVADVFLLRTLHNRVFLRGVEVGVAGTTLSCLVLLAPYCLTAGYLLTLACRLLARGEEAASIGQVYFLDNIGDVVGGVLFSFVLIHLLDHFGILYLPALMNLALAAAVAWQARRRVLGMLAVVLCAATLAVMVLVDLEAFTRRVEYAPQKVLFSGNSRYGSLVVTEQAGQLNFIENGQTLFTSHDRRAVEETVHFPMAQRPAARRVLLIGGGASGTAREILKYPRARVDYVELDPLVLHLARRFLPENLGLPELSTPQEQASTDASRSSHSPRQSRAEVDSVRRLRIINTDGRRYVKQTSQRYDVVIVDVPDPATSQLNRFYTREFFQEVRRILNPHGVLCFSLGEYQNYLSPELARLLATTRRTAGGVFDHVLVLPGHRIFFLASSGPLSPARSPAQHIHQVLQEQGIETTWLRPGYLQATLSPDRLAEIQRALVEPGAENRDFSPVLYYHHLRYWMSHFQVRFGLFEAVLVLLLAAYLWRVRAVPLALFTTGFAASALEVVLLLGVQVLYGYVYSHVSVIVTAFMAGLGIGSWSMNRLLKRCTRAHLVALELAVALAAVCLPLVLLGLGRLGGTTAALAGQVGVPLLALGVAVLVGLEFPLAGKADFRGVAASAARLYTADYVGAALGALLVSTWLIPLWGVFVVCLLCAAINLLSALVLATGRRG